MSHNPLNEECKYGKQICVNPPGIPCACPVCTCVPKQDWKDAMMPLLQRTWDNNAGYYDWVDFIRQLRAEARKEERKGYTAGLERAKEIAKQTVYAVEGRVSFDEAINKEIQDV
jgi:hypothetical protein